MPAGATGSVTPVCKRPYWMSCICTKSFQTTEKKLELQGFKTWSVVYCYHQFMLARSIYIPYFFSSKQEAARHKTNSLYNFAISTCFSCCKQSTAGFFYSRYLTPWHPSLSMSPSSSTAAQVRWDLGMSRSVTWRQTNKLNLYDHGQTGSVLSLELK